MLHPKSKPAMLTPANFTPAASAWVALKARTELASRFLQNMMVVDMYFHRKDVIWTSDAEHRAP